MYGKNYMYIKGFIGTKFTIEGYPWREGLEGEGAS